MVKKLNGHDGDVMVKSALVGFGVLLWVDEYEFHFLSLDGDFRFVPTLEHLQYS